MRLSVMLQILINALRETLYMVLYASLLSVVIGLPLGFFMANLSDSPSRFGKKFYLFLQTILQTARSVPYLLIMLLFIPTTNWLINQQINFTSATIIPLSVAGSLLLSLQVFELFVNLKQKWHTTIKAMGATSKQALFLIFLPESIGPLVNSIAYSSSAIVGFSVIAGAFGAGGLGQLAIEKTITEPNYKVALISIITIVAIQQFIKYTGYLIIPQKYLR